MRSDTTTEDFVYIMLLAVLCYEKCPVTLKEYIVCALNIGGWALMRTPEDVTDALEHL
jgi:hypothetical protein